MGKKLLAGFILLLLIYTVPRTNAQSLTQKAQEDYFFQLEKYRDEYKEYLIKKGEFENLDTFATQEALVAAAKTMLHRRAEVWWTFLQALRTEMVESEGFLGDDKEKITLELEEIQTSIRDHQELLEPITTRQELLAEATVFNKRNQELIGISHKTLSSLLLQKINLTILNMEEFNTTLKEAVTIQVRDPNDKEIRLRGVEEVTNLLNSCKTEIQEQYVELGWSSGEKRTSFAYDNVKRDLAPTYRKIERVNSLLNELSKGLDF